MKLRTALCMKIAIVIILLTACNSSEVEKLDFSTSHSAAVEHLSIETLEDWIEISDHVIVGEWIASRPYDTYQEYDVQVQEEIKGNISKSIIQVYSSEPWKEENKDYLLFLSSNDSEYREQVVYTVIGVPNSIEAGQIKIGPLQDKNIDQLIKTIRESPNQNVFREKHKVIQSAANINELIELSDYIVHLRPMAIAFENPSLKAVEFEILEQFKGDDRMKEKQIVRLPATVELGEEYLVFFRIYESEREEANPGITLTTREGSVISMEDDQLWENIVQSLGKNISTISE